MKFGINLVLLLAVISAANANTAEPPPATTNITERVSYGIGMSVGTSIKRAGFEVDPDTVGQAIRDVLTGAELRMTEQEAQQAIVSYQQELRAKREQERIALAEKNRAAAAKFLEENKTKPGIKVVEVNGADGNPAELQYKVLAEGSGEPPQLDHTVTFHYTSTSFDGKELDGSQRRGHPMKMLLKHYPLAGAREAMQKMKPGSKWQLFLSPTLAFGDSGAPNVEPGSGIVFEVELISAEAPQPLTSDIIKVPSKEELDKGAKIEVIKAEDAKKLQQTNRPPK